MYENYQHVFLSSFSLRPSLLSPLTLSLSLSHFSPLSLSFFSPSLTSIPSHSLSLSACLSLSLCLLSLPLSLSPFPTFVVKLFLSTLDEAEGWCFLFRETPCLEVLFQSAAGGLGQSMRMAAQPDETRLEAHLKILIPAI